MSETGNKKQAGAAWLGIGAAFLAIGVGGQTPFIGVGAAFLALGLASLARSRKGS